MRHRFVGRADTLEGLCSFVQSLAPGNPGLVLVSGEAGIGKTRLIHELGSALSESGTEVLSGACVDLRSGTIPFAPLTQALGGAPPRSVADALDALSGATELPRGRMFNLLRETVDRLTQRTRTVVVVEDLHWADEATLDALVFLLATADRGTWAVVGTYRGEEVSESPALAAMLERVASHRPARRVALDRLSVGEVEELVHALTGRPAGPLRGREIAGRSDGIPLVVEELVAAQDSGRVGVPPHLRDLYLSRVDALSAAAAAIVRAAAVAGSGILGDTVVAVSGVAQQEEATVAIEEAVAAGCLVTDGSEYGFRHELLREAVYESLVPSRRRALHEALARRLTATGSANAATVAGHWLEGGHPSQAAVCSIPAAEEAERLHAPDVAHTHLERVIALWDELSASQRSRAGGRGRVLARAAEAAFQASAFERARELAFAAVTEAADDPGALPGRLERLARFQFVVGKGEEAEALFEQALAAMTDDTPLDTRIQVLAGLAWRFAATGRSEDARPLAGTAVELADSSGDPLHRCRAMLAASCVVDDAPTAAREARDLALQIGADDEMARAYVRLVDALREQGRLDEAASEAQTGALACRDRNIETYRIVLTGWELASLVDLGRWQEAARRLSGLPHQVRGMAHAYGLMHGARLGAATGDGDLVEQVHDAIAGFIGSAPVQPTPLLVASAGRAEHLLWQARPTAALEVIGSALALPNANYPHLIACLMALGIRAHADIARGARTAARPGRVDEHVEAADDLARNLPTSGEPSVTAWSATAHAELARAHNRRVDGLWVDAIKAWSALSNPYQAAYCRWRVAETALSERTGRAAASQHLRTAWQAAVELGAEPLTAAAADLAGRARIDLGGAEASDPAHDSARELGITPREREVLELVARGRTNREIAEILMVGTRTVDTHVSRLLAKLGASRRTEAADVARRHGLVE